jgi:hypothetical protein
VEKKRRNKDIMNNSLNALNALNSLSWGVEGVRVCLSSLGPCARRVSRVCHLGGIEGVWVRLSSLGPRALGPIGSLGFTTLWCGRHFIGPVA